MAPSAATARTEVSAFQASCWFGSVSTRVTPVLAAPLERGGSRSVIMAGELAVGALARSP